MNTRTVLVVDDDPGMREVMSNILAIDRATVHTAVDGKDAIQKTLTVRPDLILLDINMPNLNGLTFCKAIRAGAETSRIPIIVVTAVTAPGKLEECMSAGADDFVEKPFRVEELLIRVRAMFATTHITDHVERLQQYIVTVRELREKKRPDTTPES